MSKQNSTPPQKSPVTTSPVAPATGRQALRERQRAAESSSRRVGIAIRTAWITGLAVIALLVGVSVWSIAGARSSTTPAVAAADGVVAPASASDTGAIVIGNADAKVTVSVFLDFMCPYCGEFERANGSALAQAVANGQAKLEVHPMSFLDKLSSGTNYSTRAANAFATVANDDPAKALVFSQLLFGSQPAENSAGLTDAQLADLATQAGVSPAVVATFGTQTYQPWVAKITQQAFSSGITGTPTVKINGTVFSGDLYHAGPLAQAISAAANG